MDYRREIDGLRALAVLPVILFHGGFQTFSGGFVGVDVFFVISGYLITTIILTELQQGHFSITRFYERRARRILPALFLVMGACSLFAYAWMMPDEFKNFGQSLLATTFFSNNILLALTTGYWDLSGEFKPLLHTWSLAVEEQYYVIAPLPLILGWRYCREHLAAILGIALALSLLAAHWWLINEPTVAFYILPTRAWEILVGALAALYLCNRDVDVADDLRNQLLSLLGCVLILTAIFVFNQNYPSPGFYTLVPTSGAVLIIIFARQGTVVAELLSSRLMVGLGLVSYSLYLWHQPLFAFARVYSMSAPSPACSAVLILVCLLLAYLTWRFVEQPCRNSKAVSRRSIFACAAIMSLVFVSLGYYLNTSYGMPSRVFAPSVRIQDMDKRAYNERVFNLKKDRFSSPEKLKILVVGDSFGRDFVNMTTETFDMRAIDIVYRNDLAECVLPFRDSVAENLYGSANVIVFTSGINAGGIKRDCIGADIAFAESRSKRIFYIGTKDFGYNLNWLIRLDPGSRGNQYNTLRGDILKNEQELSSLVPAENFISLLAPVVKDRQIPITDDSGRMLSTDRAHLTKYGARFFGERVLMKSAYGVFLRAHG